MLAAHSPVQVRHELLERMTEARTRSDELFAHLRSDSFYERPIPERHRVIFYLGHLEAFDWNLLRERVLDEKAFHPGFDHLFAFGIDPVGGGLPSDQPSDWPALADVRDYVARIRRALDAGLSTGIFHPGRKLEFPASLLLQVAIEHRFMHVETLSYMFHQLPLDRKVRKTPNAPKPELVAPPPQACMIDIPEGSATLGLSRAEQAFGWDNEYDMAQINVPPFAIDQYKVSNRQFLEFMNAGGYDHWTFWTDADWQWKTEHNISHPVFWEPDGHGGWRYRTMFDEVPLPLDWPVYVSHAEAGAYARWEGKSLPTEAQWHRAAYGTPQGSERPYPWGSAVPHSRFGNFDFRGWDPIPVHASPDGQSAFAVADLLGNGWEWTSTLFAPLPGFEPFPFYRGYSADFFDGRHYVLKGGSSRTAACMLRRSFRNWFQPHYQYVYAGFRCVSN